MWIEIRETLVEKPIVIVTPRAGVWIEMPGAESFDVATVVTPRAGVWIEINFQAPKRYGSISSLPVRECGLKYVKH